MGRVGAEGWIVMGTGIGIGILWRSGAGMALMDMETENI